MKTVTIIQRALLSLALALGFGFALRAQAPTITSQPQGVSVATGQTATFSVTATGTNLTYQWQKAYPRSFPLAISGATGSSYTTPATTSLDNGTIFSVIVTSNPGSGNGSPVSVTSANATLTVGSGTSPSITTQPANTIVNLGATATFSVAASGSATLTYQWQKNGAAITGATSASYTTPATVAGDNGATFAVVVTNSYGSVTSSNAILTVNLPPAITTQPANATVNLGGTVTFSVTASGTAPLSYQWRKNGTAIQGATLASYTTPSTVAGDNGALFSVVVTNSLGSATSNNATLTVNSPPTITTQPANTTVNAGATATFSVIASGSPTLAYQWKKNGVAITGATSASYTTPATAAGDNSSVFVVVVSNSAGSVTSGNAVLTVNSPPVITTQPANATVNLGATATFSVVASGSAPLAYQWQKNGIAIPDATSASYTTPATVAGDNGALFSVVVTNALGTATSTNAALTVISPPTLTTQPANVTVNLGATATFSVVGGGGGTLTYQWQKNGAAITGAASASYTTPATVAGDNGATFSVVVSNSAGSVTSNNAVLTVNLPPSITTQPANASVNVGSTATFSVVATGVGTLTYQWQKNGAAITGATGTSYTTPATVAGDNGATFRVVVTNAVGSTTSNNATLTVNSPPAITTQPASITVTAGATATFSVVASGSGPLGYQWQKNGAAIAGATSSSYTTPATVSGDNGAQFRVVVSSAWGSATSTSATLTIDGAPPAILTQPANVAVNLGATATFSVVASGSGTLTYQWQKNGVAISGATSTSYTSPATVAGDNGALFSVVVSNGGGLFGGSGNTLGGGGGSTTSTNAILTVNSAPVITTQPANATVNEGATATFSVAASGSAPLAYQWRKNGANITGATAASYTTSATVAADNGALFSAVVTNTAGSATSNNAVLTVNSPPTITTQPANAAVNVGAAATFSVTASGTAPLNYQWKKNGNAISGATNPTYVTPATVASDNGTLFSVVVTNMAGSATSINAVLTVNSPPTVTTQPVNTTVNQGATASFTVVASGSGTLTYQWQKNGAAITGATSASYVTPATVAGDNGALFSVVVANAFGSATSNNATLTVITPPTITTQPANATVNEGATASFSVVASGPAPLTYQWQKNGATITGAASASYTTPATVAADNGALFSVVVSNPAGSVTSSNAILTVNPLPVFNAQPVSLTVCAGATATFSVAATGATSYQWRKNGTAIVGATSATYTTPVTVAGDNGALFSVVITNAVGSVTSNNAALTVNTVPAIGSQPATTGVCAGSTAVFSVSATGATSYQWQKNGTAIPGATAASYTTPATVVEDSGASFSVVVTNACGSVSSASATLTVNTPPVITTQPLNPTITMGQTATFNVVATGSAPLSYQWQKNGVAISGATLASYTTPATVAGDNGATFSVIVTNMCGSVTSSNGVLNLIIPPSITSQPVNATVNPGQTATFSVAASGTAPLSYQWSRSNDGGTTWSDLAGATNVSFALAASVGDNGAKFHVVVTNAVGTVTSNAASLAVNIAPVITTQPQALTVTAGQPATFTVAASGTNPLAYQWRKGGVTIGGATLASFTLPATVSGDSGSYDVVVSNMAGSATSVAVSLTVNAPPPCYPTYSGPRGVTADAAGNIYVADSVNHTIRKISSTGAVSTLAGLAGQSGFVNGTGSAARFYWPWGIAVDSSGNVYVSDSMNQAIRKITPGGVVTTLAGGTYGYQDGNGSSAWFRAPRGIAIDASGRVVVADYENGAVRRIDAAGNVTTLAGGPAQSPIVINQVQDVAPDSSGNVYATCWGAGAVPGLFKITATGSISNLVANVMPMGIEVDGSGTPYLIWNNGVFRYSGGALALVAGDNQNYGFKDGTGASALFSAPMGLGKDSSGALLVADTGNNAIRKLVLPSGVVTTVSGIGVAGSQDCDTPSSPGTLQVAQTGLPLGASAGVNIANSSIGSRYLQTGQSLSGLPAGTYTLTLSQTTTVVGGAAYLGSPSPQSVTVAPASTVTATFSFVQGQSINSFTGSASGIPAATNLTLNPSQAATLAWNVTAAAGKTSTLKLTNPMGQDLGIPATAFSGTVTGTKTLTAPVMEGTYTLIATNIDGTVSLPVNIQVVSGPPNILSFGANPAAINQGQSTTLSWSVDSTATSLSISPSIGTVTGTSRTVSPASTTTYILTATNAAGSSTAQTTVTVQPLPSVTGFTAYTSDYTPAMAPDITITVPAGDPPPNVLLSAGLANLQGGETLYLDTTTGGNTTTQTITPDPAHPTEIRINVYPAATTTYVLRLVGSFGTSTATVHVTIVAGSAVSVSVSPTSATVAMGGSQTFTGTVTGSPNTAITWSVLEGAGGGSVNAYGVYTAPATGGTYHVVATSQADPTKSAQATVTVASLPVISSFTATPTSISSGQSSTLNWTVTNATSVSISGGGSSFSNLPLSGSQVVTPATTTTYILMATSASGNASDSVAVVVNGAPPPGGGGTPTMPADLDTRYKSAAFMETLSYAGSETGLITGVDVTRQLQHQVSGLATGKDRATKSHYDYGYDPLGQLVKAEGSFFEPVPNYDPLNPAWNTTAAWTDNTYYAYDQHGNRLQVPSPPPGASARSAWAYTYLPNTNRLTSTSSADFSSFTYTPDGAVNHITRNGLAQDMWYADPRFMRLPTRMVRNTADGRLVESDLRYDMSGTRTYKHDYVRETASGSGATSPDKLVSDRQTMYLANGTEVLMEVERRGAPDPTRENPAPTKIAPNRYTAYIFGAGSRLARLSWDTDGNQGLWPVNPGFEDLLTGWTVTGTGSSVLDPAGVRTGSVLKIQNGSTADQSLGSVKVGDAVEVVVQIHTEANASLAQAALLIAGVEAASPAVDASNTTTPWQTLRFRTTASAAGTLAVRLRATHPTVLNGNAYFDDVRTKLTPAATVATGQPNLLPDPGFESLLGAGAEAGSTVATNNTPGSYDKVRIEASGDRTGWTQADQREGLHVLRIETGGLYQRTVTGLAASGTYTFSIWKKPDGGSWQRVIQPLTADASGNLNLSQLSGPALYDQAELVAGNVANESWIPENRLGRMDWFITDHLGSTKLLIDQTGAHRFTGDDDPFGINLRSFGDKDSHRFTGQILDEEQGVYYYGARYYLPEIGRFLSGDPKQENGSIYLYAANKPIMMVDPNGKEGRGYVNMPNHTIYIQVDMLLSPASTWVGYKNNLSLAPELEKHLNSNWNNDGKGWVVPVTTPGWIFSSTENWHVQVHYTVYTKQAELPDKNNFTWLVGNNAKEWKERGESIKNGDTGYVGGRSFNIRGFSVEGSSLMNVLAHVGGHSFGLWERYDQITGKPSVNWLNWGGNVMGIDDTSKVESRNFDKMVPFILNMYKNNPSNPVILNQDAIGDNKL